MSDFDFKITIRVYDDTDPEVLARVISEALESIRLHCDIGTIGFIDTQYEPTQLHLHK